MTPIAIMIHHTAGSEQSAPALRATFLERFGANYIGYHYAIAPNGDIWKDIQDDQVGIHNNEGNINNYNSLAISFVGDFTSREPTTAAWNKAKQVIRTIKKANPQVKTLLGHRDRKSTACPGNRIYARLGELRAELNNPGGTTMDPLDSIKVPGNVVKLIYTEVRGVEPKPTDPDYPQATSERPLRFVLDMLREAKNRGIDIGKQQAGGTPLREVNLLQLLEQTKVKIQ